MPVASALLDELQPRRLSLRLVAGGRGEMGTEQRVDEIPNAAAFLAPVNGADGLQLAHDLRDVVRRDAAHAAQLVPSGHDLVAVRRQTAEQAREQQDGLLGPLAVLEEVLDDIA